MVLNKVSRHKLKKKMNFVKKWTFAGLFSSTAPIFWLKNFKTKTNRDITFLSLPIDSSWLVDHFRAQVYWNPLKNGKVMPILVLCDYILAIFGHYFWPKMAKYWHKSNLTKFSTMITWISIFHENLNFKNG